MGRPRSPGTVYYLGRIRWEPGDPVALREFLEEFEATEAGRKQDVLKAALVGGLAEGRADAAVVEDGETTELLEGLLGEF